MYLFSYVYFYLCYYKNYSGYIFDVNTKTIIKVSKNTIDCLNHGNENEEIKNLENLGFLSMNHIEEIGYQNNGKLEFLLESCLSHLILQVTQKCNLICSYCPYANFKNNENRNHSNKNMSWNIAKRSLDFFIKHSTNSDELNVGFYGGEPLLNFELIKKCVCYLKNNIQGKKITYNLTSNATLINKDQMKFFIENNFQVTLSIDGPKDIHDKYRKFPDGKGTFLSVMDNLAILFNEFGDQIFNYLSINMVIVPNCNFDYLLEFANDRLLKHINIIINFVDDTYTDNNTLVTESFNSSYNYHLFMNMLKCLEIMPTLKTNSIFDISNAKFLNDKIDFQNKPNSVPKKGIPSGPCVPGKRRLFVNVNGYFFPCEKVSETSKVLKIGSIDSGFDYDRIDALLNISKLNQDECKNCWAFMFCGICARLIDNNGELSDKKIKSLCKSQKRNAMYLLREMTILHEVERDFRRK